MDVIDQFILIPQSLYNQLKQQKIPVNSLDNLKLGILNDPTINEKSQIIPVLDRTEHPLVKHNLDKQSVTKASTFITNLQHPKKNLPASYYPILEILKLPNHLILNKNAKSTDIETWEDFHY